MILLAAMLCISAAWLELRAQTVRASSEINASFSRLRPIIESFDADSRLLERFYTARTSPNRTARIKKLYTDELAKAEAMNFESLSPEERVDWILFTRFLRHQLAEEDRQTQQFAEMEPLIPFARKISDLEDSRRRLEDIDPQKAAATLDALAREITSLEAKFSSASAEKPKRTVANRAASTVEGLQRTLKRWYDFYAGYDPSFTWWCEAPYKAADEKLKKYQAFITTKLVGIAADDKTTIIGDPIGRDALIEQLNYEMIPYTPEELIDIANKEFAWCEAEMKKASRELGYGDDWKKALEHVKKTFVPPGKQPALIRDLARDAVAFLDKNDLVTIPDVAREGWRMEMMSPERQLVAPFFLGGETILVAYPTDGMSHEQKMMSLRGNNPHFAHATVFHELIPGHHLQGFMSARYHPYRRDFATPFNTEGWALYWEFLMWDLGYQKTPEDRIGALFWRMHRCARIIFSLNFHLEKMTPLEAVDFLVERVGHERENALAEVRRSFGGDYGPLYQVAYMMGGIQFYRLHKELVDSGKMTNRQFHDSILHEGPIPVEMVRAILTKQNLPKDFKTSWRYY